MRAPMLAFALIPLIAGATAQDDSASPPETIDVPTLPATRGGQDLVNSEMPELTFDRWVVPVVPVESDARNADNDGDADDAADDDAADNGRDDRPPVTLYRWWTDGCPFCESSLPAFEKLRNEYGPKGLRVVAVYHPKPPRDVEDDVIRRTVREIGFTGPVALDQDWTELRRFYLSTGRRSATSASFLVDRDGVIRFVHPGPELFPSDDRRHARENADFELLTEAIQAVLANATTTKRE